MKIEYKKNDERAVWNIPHYSGDAGADLLSLEGVELTPHTPVKIRTGISVCIPDGYVGLIWDKSSIGALGIKTLGGVIDSGYRGEILVTLINCTQENIALPPGKKIAQLLVQSCESIEIEEVQNLPDSHRGEKGFGSSGQ